MTTVAELMALISKPALLEVQLAALVQERDQLLVDLNGALIDLAALKARLASFDAEAEPLEALEGFLTTSTGMSSASTQQFAQP